MLTVLIPSYNRPASSNDALANTSQWEKLLYILFVRDASLSTPSLAATSGDKAHSELNPITEKYTCTILWAQNALD